MSDHPDHRTIAPQGAPVRRRLLIVERDANKFEDPWAVYERHDQSMTLAATGRTEHEAIGSLANGLFGGARRSR